MLKHPEKGVDVLLDPGFKGTLEVSSSVPAFLVPASWPLGLCPLAVMGQPPPTRGIPVKVLPCTKSASLLPVVPHGPGLSPLWSHFCVLLPLNSHVEV